MPGRGSLGNFLRRPLELAFLAVALIFLFLVLHFVVTHPIGTLDFVNFYTAGTILREGSGHHLYDLSLQAKIQRPLSPAGPFLPFYHPPFEALLFAVFAYLPFTLAFLVWDGLNLVVLGIIFYLLSRIGPSLDNDSSLIWLAFCFPLVAGVLVLGQDSLLLALVFLLAYLAMKRRREFAAGLALGLGLFRFEILLPFVFVFLLRRRWKVLAGLSVAAFLALFASAATVGWNGLYKYVKALIEVAQASGKWSSGLDVSVMPSLRGALAAFSNGAIPAAWIFSLSLVGTLLLLGWAAWEFRSIAEPERPSFDLQFSFAVVAALLAGYHVFAHELTPLIVVAFLLLGYERVTRGGRKLLDRPCATLLLLFSLTMVVSAVLDFHSFSVLFVVLLGLMVCLSQEMAEPRLG